MNPEVKAVVDEVGIDKAPRELLKRGICTSRKQARRELHHYKIETGQKEAKNHDDGPKEG